MNFFEVFGLPRRLDIDRTDLERRFYELSRQYHPDFHQGEPPEEQARALESSALVNAAYRALRDPISRVEYLIRLGEGRDTREAAVVSPKAPPALLEEMFEIQEALAEARARGVDEGVKAALWAQRERLIDRHRAEEDRISGDLSRAWDDTPEAERGAVLAAFREALATRAYLRTVIDDLAVALGEDEGALVSNRRH